MNSGDALKEFLVFPRALIIIIIIIIIIIEKTHQHRCKRQTTKLKFKLV